MNTILYINPLTQEINLSIFGENETITKTLTKNLDTATTFPKMLVDMMDNYDINEIWCITGPGPFTLMRVITLAINAVIFARNIRVKSAHFFDLIGDGHIPIIEANPREYLIKKNNEVIHIEKEKLEAGVYEGIF